MARHVVTHGLEAPRPRLLAVDPGQGDTLGSVAIRIVPDEVRTRRRVEQDPESEEEACDDDYRQTPLRTRRRASAVLVFQMRGLYASPTSGARALRPRLHHSVDAADVAREGSDGEVNRDGCRPKAFRRSVAASSWDRLPREVARIERSDEHVDRGIHIGAGSELPRSIARSRI